MKNFLYSIVAILILPIVLMGVLIYGVSYVLELVFRTIMICIDKGMSWVNKNITPNI